MKKCMGISPGRLIPVIILVGIFIICITGCFKKSPILIGFTAQLTGVQSGLGVQERNGVMLAVEQINARGGICGRRIELLVQDDLGTPEGARDADRALVEKKVVAIIGHATSVQTLAGLCVTNPAGMVMISPSASTPELNGKSDYFFRVCGTCTEYAHELARHIRHCRNITRVAVIYDTDNMAYSKSIQAAFTEKFQSLGGIVAAEAGFSSRTQPDFSLLVERLRTGSAKGLLIIAGDLDTALIAQRVRLTGGTIPLFTTQWAQTDTLINNGGQAVEGLELFLVHSFDNTPGYLDFKARCLERFGQAPSFGTVFGYEAVQVLAAALEKTFGRADGLPGALAGIKDFKGLGDAFSINQYGDAVRPHYLGVVRNAKYVYTKTILPAKF